MHRFHNVKTLRCALTHRSCLPETGALPSEANERLELLGDAVLDLIVVDYLWRRFPKLQEGDLSKLKAMLVSGTALQQVAQELRIGDFILMSESEARNGGRRRSSILEDTLEALIAALYLDGGMRAAERFVHKHILCRVDELTAPEADCNYKSKLLEYAQGRGICSPEYRIVREYGPDHRKGFDVAVFIGGVYAGEGSGASKKAAQQMAAKNALENIDQLHPDIIEPHNTTMSL